MSDLDDIFAQAGISVANLAADLHDGDIAHLATGGLVGPAAPKKRKAKAQHSAETPRWGTPEYIIEACRRAMGGIDFDPCSEKKFNEVVRADHYLSLLEHGEDALVEPWQGKRRLVNPPGGLITEFWRRAMEQSARDIQTMWIGFSLEQLALLAEEEHHPTDFAICFLRKRIRFTRWDGYSGSPSHSNYIAGINVDPRAFLHAFGTLGKVQFGPSVVGAEMLAALLAAPAS